MKNNIVKLTKSFEEHAYIKDGLEFWLARELQELLGYRIMFLLKLFIRFYIPK